MDSTLNYTFIEELNKLNLPIEDRVGQFCSEAVYSELKKALPYYEASCEPGILKNEEFDTHPPFIAFRSSFVKAWNYLTELVAARRAELNA